MSDTSFNPTMYYEMVGGNNTDNIGANNLVVTYDSGPNNGTRQTTRIMIDRGLMFGKGTDTAGPSYDAVMTNCDTIYPTLDAIVMTHAHQDHIGALGCDILRGQKIPEVWCTPVTQAYIQSDFIKKGIDSRRWPEFKRLPTDGSGIVIGDMTVSAFPASHSIPEAVGLIITSPAGSIAHSGDFKTDPTVPVGPIYDDQLTRRTVQKTLRSWPEQQQIDLLAVDSTRSSTPGLTPSEEEVGKTLRNIVTDNTDNRIITSMFSTHLSRIVQMADIAADTGRTLIVSGAAMEWSLKTLAEAAKIYRNERKQPPWLPDPVMGVLSKSNKMSMNDVEAVMSSIIGGKKVHIITADSKEVRKIPAHQQMILCTGTQGEPESSLTKAAMGRNNDVKIDKNDVVIISGSVIPGNEEEVGSVVSALQKNAGQVITVKDALVHTSGHGRAEDIQTLVNAINPRAVLPIHGSQELLQQHYETLVTNNTHRMVIPATGNGHQIALRPGHQLSVQQTDSPAFIGVKNLKDSSGNIYYEFETCDEFGQKAPAPVRFDSPALQRPIRRPGT